MSDLLAGKKQYVGDGVYVTYDGYHLWLSTERDDGMVHLIALEPTVYIALNTIATQIWNIKTVTTKDDDNADT